MIEVITPLPPAPSRGDQPDVFVERADAFLAALPRFGTETNEAASLFYLTGHWFGQRAADPAISPLGGPLIAGDAYYNTTRGQLRIYNESGVWRGFDIDSDQLAAADGARLIGHGAGTVEDALNNIDGNLNFTTLDTAAPADDADLMILRQGSQNKKISIGTVRGEFATDAVQAQIAAEAARDAALIQAGVYATEALGRAAVADGQAFKVQGDGGDVAAFEYRRTSSEASSLIGAYPSANAPVTPGRTTFLIPGKNLFNKFTATLGKYLTETGVLTDNPVHAVSDYIAVTPGATYYANASGMRYTCYFDKDKIVQVGGSDVGTSPFTVPLGISYVRVTMFIVDLNIFQLENGPTSAYEPFKYRLALASGVPIVTDPAPVLPNSISTDAVQRMAVTPEKTNFLTVGKNKFNAATVTEFKYVTSTGSMFDSPNYDTSDYIAVTPGQYKCSAVEIRFSCNYDADKNVMSGGHAGNASVDTLTIPAGVAYVRISVGHIASPSLQFEPGAISTEFERFQYTLSFGSGAPITPGSDSVGSDSIKLSAVTPEKTSFLAVGKNRFDPNSVDEFRYITANGSMFNSASYDTSDYIAVVPGPYKCNVATIRFSCNFDVNKNVVPGGYDGNTSVDTLIIPAGTAFIRIAVGHNDNSTLQFEVGSASTEFESYALELGMKNGTPVRLARPPADIAAPPVVAPKHYIPAGKELALHLENVVQDYQSYKGRVGITFEEGRETGEATKFIPNGGQIGASVSGVARVVSKTYDLLVSAKARALEILVTDPSNAVPMVMGHIGDSFTRRFTWTNVINDTAAFAGLTYTGTRTAADASTTISCEGQGGWAMIDYFTVDRGADELSPFMQPGNAGLKYYGPCAFWIRAHIGVDYNADNMRADILDGFSPTTGRKLAPAVADVMREGAGYIIWDGASWVTLAPSSLNGWVFSYARYRAVWGIARPDCVHILMGANDFAGAEVGTFDGMYAPYKARYDQMIASVRADNPACKAIVAIPVSSARQGEYGTLTTERIKRVMWLLARNLVADYGGREAEGIYLLDYHSIVDRVYGFDSEAEKPGVDYTGGDRYKYFPDYTHCGTFGSAQMGNAYMGLIQHLRTLT